MFAFSGNKFDRASMVSQMEASESTCKLCLTTPEGFVYSVHKQTAWCPRCGMPPVPQPQFMEEGK